jgi:hypothetical protein
MAIARKFIFQAFIALAALVTVLTWSYTVHAAEPLSSGGKVMRAKFSAIKTRLEKNQFGMPLYLESKEKSGSLHVEVYGIYDYPFNSIRDALQAPGNWCDINLLLMNIKACTYRNVSGQWQLSLYSGRKYYQSPRDAYKLDFTFDIAASQPEYLDVVLTAKNGPFFTRDHRISLEAVLLDKSVTFIHFSYDYDYGLLARTALNTYYATIGHGKKGFSIITTDKKGDPVYVGGVRGSVERSAVRYYLAIQTYMDTLNIPLNQRFEKRLSRWYELTARFPRQLYELDKGEYLANKRREHINQLMLQIEASK